jgi:hypothetical protein
MATQSERDLMPAATADFPQSRGEGFSSIEMVSCPTCERRNPPTRAACLYCGAALAHTGVAAVSTHATVDAVQIPSNPAALESWEQGYTVMLLAGAAEAFHVGAPPVVAAEIKRLFGIEEDQLRRMIKSGVALPLARLREREQAELTGRRLAALALPIEILPDAELRCGELEINRVRRLEITNTNLRVWSRVAVAAHEVDDATATLALTEIVALVRGRIFTREIETSTPHARGNNAYVAADERAATATSPSFLEPPAKQTRELFADDSVLDIYTTRAEETWRIHAGSFDYSCLGQDARCWRATISSCWSKPCASLQANRTLIIRTPPCARCSNPRGRSPHARTRADTSDNKSGASLCNPQRLSATKRSSPLTLAVARISHASA